MIGTRHEAGSLYSENTGMSRITEERRRDIERGRSSGSRAAIPDLGDSLPSSHEATNEGDSQ